MIQSVGHLMNAGKNVVFQALSSMILTARSSGSMMVAVMRTASFFLPPRLRIDLRMMSRFLMTVSGFAASSSV